MSSSSLRLGSSESLSKSGKSFILLEFAKRCCILKSLWMLAKFLKPLSLIFKHLIQFIGENEFLKNQMFVGERFFTHQIVEFYYDWHSVPWVAAGYPRILSSWFHYCSLWEFSVLSVDRIAFHWNLSMHYNSNLMLQYSRSILIKNSLSITY